MRNVDKKDLKNSPLLKVKLLLNCGRIVNGFISPPFWVREGYGKINYPQRSGDYLPIIVNEAKDLYAQFQDGKMLFDEIPVGYEEIQLDYISYAELIE